MWKINFIPKAEKEFLNLDGQIRNRIIDAVNNKLLEHPENHLVPLLGGKSEL